MPLPCGFGPGLRDGLWRSPLSSSKKTQVLAIGSEKQRDYHCSEKVSEKGHCLIPQSTSSERLALIQSFSKQKLKCGTCGEVMGPPSTSEEIWRLQGDFTFRCSPEGGCSLSHNMHWRLWTGRWCITPHTPVFCKPSVVFTVVNAVSDGGPGWGVPKSSNSLWEVIENKQFNERHLRLS